MEQAWQEVSGEVPQGQVVLSAEAINQAYADLTAALKVEKETKRAFFYGDAGNNELYYQSELADIDVQIARAEVDRLTKLMDLLGLQVVSQQMEAQEE